MSTDHKLVAAGETEFLVMRHGQSEADLADPKVFEPDTPLTAAGLTQARLAAEWIAANYKLHRIITSPLKRARRTAKEVGRAVELKVEIEVQLRERKNGKLAGLTEAQAKAKGLWRRDYLPHETVPGGETLIEFRARAETFWSRLLNQSQRGQRILIVSHGQMIGMLFRAFLKLPMNDSVRLPTGDTGIHCWRMDKKGPKIVFINSRVHLKVGQAIPKGKGLIRGRKTHKGK